MRISGQSAGHAAAQHLDEIGPELKIKIDLARKQSKLASELLSSGGPALVAMMQSTDLRDCDDSASICCLDWPRLRTVLGQCQMCPAAMVVIKEHFEMPTQTALVEYDHVIEALAANGADHAFDICTLPW